MKGGREEVASSSLRCGYALCDLLRDAAPSHPRCAFPREITRALRAIIAIATRKKRT